MPKPRAALRNHDARAGELPRCAQCGREAERKYPDQSEEDVMLPCSDGAGREFCSRSCAIEFGFTLCRRCGVPGQRESLTELRAELNELYEAAVVLANLSDQAIGFVEASDEGQGLLDATRTREEDTLAQDFEFASSDGLPASERFVDLKSLRGLANDLCRLLGGEEGDPKWLGGDPESRAAEEWLEALVEFRTHSFSNEVWPLAQDLTRAQIAGLYAFYVAQARSGQGPGIPSAAEAAPQCGTYGTAKAAAIRNGDSIRGSQSRNGPGKDTVLRPAYAAQP